MKRRKHSPTQCYNNLFLKWTQCFSREFRRNRSIYDFPTYSTRCCLLLRLFFFRTEASAKAQREWHAQDTRMTSDEALGTLGRRKMRGEALPRPHSPSRLPLRGNFHRGRRRLGMRQAQNPCEVFQWEVNLLSGGDIVLKWGNFGERNNPHPSPSPPFKVRVFLAFYR